MKVLKDLKLRHNTDNTIMAYLNSVFLLNLTSASNLSAPIFFLDKPYKPTTLRKEKQKEQKEKDKQSNSPLTLQGSIFPCNIITSTSARKITFTQTRAHKYLSVRNPNGRHFPGFVPLRLSVAVSS